MRNSKWFTTQRPLTILGFVIFLLYLVYWAVIVVFHPKRKSVCDYKHPEAITSLHRLVSTLGTLVIIVVIVIMAFKFRKHRSKDELSFVSHFTWGGLTGMVSIITYTTLSRLYKFDPTDHGAILPIVGIIGYLIASYYVIAAPLRVYYKRYGSTNRIQPFDSSTFTSLFIVLQHQMSRERFARFVASEFSSGEFFFNSRR